TLYDVPADVSGSITPTGGGATAAPATTTPGQNAGITFSGAAGQRVSLKISGVSLSDPSQYETVSVLKPDGSTLAGSGAVTSAGWIDTQTLPTAGTYKVFVDPQKNTTASTNLAVYDVPADASSAATVDTTPGSVTTTVPGQDGRITFT